MMVDKNRKSVDRLKSPALELKLSNALLELLLTYSYDKISVTKICKQAQVNRTSFYLCFNNIDDCLSYTFNRFLKPFYKIFSSKFALNQQIGKDSAAYYLNKIFLQFKQVHQIIESNNLEIQNKFLQLIKKIAFDHLLKLLKNKKYDQITSEFYAQEFVNSLVSLLQFWLKHPELNPDYIANLCYKCLFKGINAVLD